MNKGWGKGDTAPSPKYPSSRVFIKIKIWRKVSLMRLLKILIFSFSLILVVLFSKIERAYCSCAKPAQMIPDGAIWANETIRRAVAPPGFHAVIGWLQAATLSPDQSGEPAKIIVDYMKLIEQDPEGNESVIYKEHYNDSRPRALSIDEGGLYDRHPWWFATDEHTRVFNSEIRDGYLTIDVSQTPNRIVHWWTYREWNNVGHRYFLELRVKVQGAVGLQLGSDFWVDLESPWNGYDEK